MALIDPRITADRVRAALAFANIDIKASGEKTGIGYATMQRIVSSTNPRGASTDELDQIAAACVGVPRWFLEHGFAPPAATGGGDLRGEVSELRRSVQDLIGQVAEHGRELRELRGRGRGEGSTEDGPR